MKNDLSQELCFKKFDQASKILLDVEENYSDIFIKESNDLLKEFNDFLKESYDF